LALTALLASSCLPLLTTKPDFAISVIRKQQQQQKIGELKYSTGGIAIGFFFSKGSYLRKKSNKKKRIHIPS